MPSSIERKKAITVIAPATEPIMLIKSISTPLLALPTTSYFYSGLYFVPLHVSYLALIVVARASRLAAIAIQNS